MQSSGTLGHRGDISR